MKTILSFSFLCLLLFGVAVCFVQAQETAPSQPSMATHAASFDIAMKHYRQGHYAQAIGEFNQVVQADPNNAAAYYFMGYAHYVMKHNQEAIEAFGKAFQADPKFDPRPYFRGR